MKVPIKRWKQDFKTRRPKLHLHGEGSARQPGLVSVNTARDTLGAAVVECLARCRKIVIDSL